MLSGLELSSEVAQAIAAAGEAWRREMTADDLGGGFGHRESLRTLTGRMRRPCGGLDPGAKGDGGVADPLWLEIGSIGAGGILVLMILDRVSRLITAAMKGRNGRRNNGSGVDGSGVTPAWRVSELLSEILGTLKQMRADLVRMRDEIAAIGRRTRGE